MTASGLGKFWGSKPGANALARFGRVAALGLCQLRAFIGDERGELRTKARPGVAVLARRLFGSGPECKKFVGVHRFTPSTTTSGATSARPRANTSSLSV